MDMTALIGTLTAGTQAFVALPRDPIEIEIDAAAIIPGSVTGEYSIGKFGGAVAHGGVAGVASFSFSGNPIALKTSAAVSQIVITADATRDTLYMIREIEPNPKPPARAATAATTTSLSGSLSVGVPLCVILPGSTKRIAVAIEPLVGEVQLGSPVGFSYAVNAGAVDESGFTDSWAVASPDRQHEIQCPRGINKITLLLPTYGGSYIIKILES